MNYSYSTLSTRIIHIHIYIHIQFNYKIQICKKKILSPLLANADPGPHLLSADLLFS
jgi:hypothetical protein